MLKPDQLIKVKWNGQTKQYWLNKGYTYTKIGDEFAVRVEDLPLKSAMFVDVVCDYCGDIFSMRMYSYTACSQMGKISCRHCKGNKAKETNLVKYGVENAMQVDAIHSKMKQSMQERYGVEHPSQCKELHDKAIQEFDAVKAAEKRKATCIAKYGVDNAAKTQEVIDKAKATCIERYGGESSQCSDEIKQKTWQSMYRSGIIPTSKPERQMVELIKAIYGENNCTPQYGMGRISMDCLLTVNDIKIDVEYDGAYWHKDKNRQDERRDWYCINRGYKVLRFCGKENPPTKEQIIKSVNYLVNSGHDKLKINI